MKTYRIGTIV